MKVLRISTFAAPLSGNKGSASMVLGLRDAFVRANLQVALEVFSYYPKRDVAHAEGLDGVTVHPGHPKDLAFALLPSLLLHRTAPALVPSTYRNHVSALLESDAVFVIGGTTFADSMLYKVPWNVLAALPGLIARKPTVLLSQTIGPLRSQMNRMAARYVLRRVTEAHGRGRVSVGWMKEIGVRRCLYRPDLSFAMQTPRFDDIAASVPIVGALDETRREDGRPLVGIAPNSIVAKKSAKVGIDYVGFLAEATRLASNDGYLPVLIPHSYRSPGSGSHNNDRRLCEAVLSRLNGGTRSFYLDADLPAEQLRSVIGELHVLVASRFHSMISALAMGVPPLTYGWGDHKYSEVLAEFGLLDLYRDYRSLDLAGLENRLRDACTRREDLSEQIGRVLPDVLRDVHRLPEDMLDLLGRKSAGR